MERISRNPGLWNNEIDVAPETLYSMATHSPLPGWMKPEASVRETA